MKLTNIVMAFLAAGYITSNNCNNKTDYTIKPDFARPIVKTVASFYEGNARIVKTELDGYVIKQISKLEPRNETINAVLKQMDKNNDRTVTISEVSDLITRLYSDFRGHKGADYKMQRVFH